MLGLPKFGRGIGLHRILRFCDLHNLDLAELGSRSVVLTGSNGKGSTAAFSRALLSTCYDRVACFTSPHLYEVYERFTVAGEEIAPHEFSSCLATVLDYNTTLKEQSDYLGAFESLFLAALLWFDSQDIDCAVWEAGIGGRYDPVRTLQCEFSALTSVELEHADLLGPTTELIAYDKLDVTRPGGTTFVSPSVPQALHSRLAAFARVSKRHLRFVSDEAETLASSHNNSSTDFTVRLRPTGQELSLVIPLPGPHQISNCTTALLLVSEFLASRRRGLDANAIRNSLSAVNWPGRLEMISAEPEIWIDVGHTPEAIALVSEHLASQLGRRKPIVVFGVSAGKAVREIVRAIEPHFDAFFLTCAHKNGTPPNELLSHFSDPSRVIGASSSIEDAVVLSTQLAKDSQRPLVVLGGLFLAAEFAYCFRGGDPQSLDFF